MSELTFIDGKKLDEKPNRSLLYGEGIFETFRWKSKAPKYISDHVNRLRDGSKLLKIPFPYEEEYILEKVKEAVVRSVSDDLYVKLALISKGDSIFKIPSASSLLITTKPYFENSKDVSVCISSHVRNQRSVLVRYKTINYIEYILGRREAVETGFDDAIFLNTNDELTEATSSNLFWIKGTNLLTPSVESGILAGITRKIILSVAKQLGYTIHCSRFDLSSLLDSDFAFLTNSLRGMSLISRVDGHAVSSKLHGYEEIKFALFKELDWGQP